MMWISFCRASSSSTILQKLATILVALFSAHRHTIGQGERGRAGAWFFSPTSFSLAIIHCNETFRSILLRSCIVWSGSSCLLPREISSKQRERIVGFFFFSHLEILLLLVSMKQLEKFLVETKKWSLLNKARDCAAYVFTWGTEGKSDHEVFW